MLEIEVFSMDYYDEIMDLWKSTGISIGSSDDKAEVERMLARNPDLFLIGKEDDKVIGVVEGAFDGRRGYVHHLAIDPVYQKKGYGKKLMNNLMERFREKKIHKIHLFVEKSNKNAINFYKHLGWELRKYLAIMSIVPDESIYRPSI
jgi:ribosomal protein S18 acetylase RimI-like enzyme